MTDGPGTAVSHETADYGCNRSGELADVWLCMESGEHDEPLRVCSQIIDERELQRCVHGFIGSSDDWPSKSCKRDNARSERGCVSGRLIPTDVASTVPHHAL